MYQYIIIDCDLCTSLGPLVKVESGNLTRDDNYGDNFETNIQPETDEDIFGLTVPGQAETRRRAKMREIEEILKNAGWLDSRPDGKPDVGDLQPIELAEMRTGSLCLTG